MELKNNAIRLDKYGSIYMNELLNNVLPFWLENSLDRQYGGYFNCLRRDGSVFDTDKFMWLQAREVWTFATMYNKLEAKSEWFEMAQNGTNFLKKYGRDKNGNWYFSLTRQGEPLTQPYNIFSDCFAAMAFGAMEKIQPGEGYSQIALKTFENILKRKDNPKGVYNKEYPGTRNLKGFALPMILCNLALEIEHILGYEKVDNLIPVIIKEIMEQFYQPQLGLIVENVDLNGRLSDSFEGRLMNPGHSVEAMWFMMDLANRLNDTALLQRAVDIAINEIEYGWDNKYGGIFYFLDRLGNPPQQLEWDQKLWWVHLEALVAMAKGYVYTGDERCVIWFETLHEYCWSHFRDQQYPEWYGYLNRKGEVLLPLKGGKWKCCFHLPRALMQISSVLAKKESKVIK